MMDDIADQDRIEGVRWDHSLESLGCWKHITRWSFLADRVATAPAIFTVPQTRSTMMCTNVLGDAVAAHKLLGFEFKLLWSPDGGGVEIDNSPGQLFGESGRQMNIAGKERRRAMLATLKAHSKTGAAKS